MHPIIKRWRESLQKLLNYYETRRPRLRYFYPALFVFFVFLNMFCYWWAMVTAFPDLLLESKRYYFKVQFPVGFLGALFDSLSFFVTIYIIRRALASTTTRNYVTIYQ